MKPMKIYKKHIDWKYEKEWRIIGDKGLAIYPSNSIDRVIFGVKMPVEERNTIRNILKHRNVKFFEAVKSKRHFAVEIMPIGELNKLSLSVTNNDS